MAAAHPNNPGWYEPFLIDVAAKGAGGKASTSAATQGMAGAMGPEGQQEQGPKLAPLAAADVHSFFNRFSEETKGQVAFLSLANGVGGVDELPTGTSLCKSVAILVSGEPVVAVVSGETYVDTKKIARWARCGRKQVKLASDAQCVDIFGYPKNALPPFGHRQDTAQGTPKVLVDAPLLEGQELLLYVGGGERDSAVRLPASTLVFVTSAEIGAFSKPGAGGTSVLEPKTPTAAPLIGLPPDYAAAPGSDPSEIRFLIDVMLGRLARWLRVLGMDVVHWPTVSPRGDYSALAGAAASSGRIVLTRDSKLAARRDGPAAVFLVTTDDTQAQFEEVVRHFGLVFREEDFMSRCAVCNMKGFAVIAREEAERRGVKPKVLAKVAEFFECTGCGKVYWEGPKFSTACEKFSCFLEDSSTKPNHEDGEGAAAAVDDDGGDGIIVKTVAQEKHNVDVMS
uniref:Mut7-C RNAse domain-containing protein n=1 Tax=Heterosigma akashiwo TaxID=2829 RepID=A0A7S3UXL7_HETAK